VSGYPGTPSLDTIVGCVIYATTPPTGTFETSHPLVNRLYRNIRWTQRGNFMSVPTDCPQRDERLGWPGDAQIFARTANYTYDVAAFFAKWMVDIADAQDPSGAFTDVAPAVKGFGQGNHFFADAGIIVPWTLYQVYGDTRIIEEHYEAMSRWVAYMVERSVDCVRSGGYGDWLSIDAETPKDLVATAFFAYTCHLLARMDAVIGRWEDARAYDDLHTRVREAFNRAFVVADGRVAGHTQTGYALALALELLPPEKRSDAARHLVEDIRARNWHVSTGFAGVSFLLPALTECGYVEDAYRLLVQDTFPSWGYPMRHGATTIWERWDGWTEDKGFQDPAMNSFNHFALGSVGEWLFRYVAGIDVDPERPGYKHVIRPHPGGGLTYAGACFQSAHGTVVAAWRMEDGALTVEVVIPANTTATVSIPASDPIGVTESGRTVDEAQGVEFVRMEHGRAVLAVQSGTYAFVSGLAMGS